MTTYIGIILGCVCLIAIAIGGYYLYNRIVSQQQSIDTVISHQMDIERVLSRPPPRQELYSFMESQKNDCVDCEVTPIPGLKLYETETQQNNTVKDDVDLNHQNIVLDQANIDAESSETKNEI